MIIGCHPLRASTSYRTDHKYTEREEIPRPSANTKFASPSVWYFDNMLGNQRNEGNLRTRVWQVR